MHARNCHQPEDWIAAIPSSSQTGLIINFFEINFAKRGARRFAVLRASNLLYAAGYSRHRLCAHHRNDVRYLFKGKQGPLYLFRRSRRSDV